MTNSRASSVRSLEHSIISFELHSHMMNLFMASWTILNFLFTFPDISSVNRNTIAVRTVRNVLRKLMFMPFAADFSINVRILPMFYFPSSSIFS